MVIMEGIQEDMGDGSMQCANHPYKNSSPGGVCALCLQEKLGKLVSSSFPSAIFPSSSSSSSTPSVRSELGGGMAAGGGGGATASSQPVQTANKAGEGDHHHQFESAARKPRIPFQRRKKKSNNNGESSSSATVFKRSKSATTPRNRMGFLEGDENDNGDDISPRKRGFWSFLYYSASKKIEKPASIKDASFPSSSASGNGSMVVRDKKRESFAVVEENERSDQSSHERKVSRSRSVGCGSRSFSGEFFERISTGFGDCTLRRVESQREGKPKAPPSVQHRNSGASGQDCIRERVKCGGIFSGFMIIASSSSSSSDWVSSEENKATNNPTIPPASVDHHGRSKNWGWALASPIRAFTSKPSTGKTEASNKNTTPNLAAIPSLLTVRS
ncbi:PREDICTED: uncharacterized protein LOC109176080 [Ipomoea nil]|uniref:uncharacterized protein LOC109176080 n=1 Tax=Ipomoea nil TaxID=35883 RepID=UPI0009011C7A|nr:PREDICTED: uncharacterized protein LOC109176080 [Ipomoea nil]